MNTFDAVKQALHVEVSSMGPLPPFLEETIGILSKARLYYRAYKLGSTYQQSSKDPEKGNPVAYGAALHLAADHTSLNYALSAALAAKCAADLLSEYRHVSESTQEFWDAVNCQYPLYHPVEWKQEHSSWTSLILPSFNLYCHIKTMQMVTQLKKVSGCSAKIIWDTFRLSMSMADAYLILNGDPSARFESFTELVAEWENYEGELEENTKRLLEELEKNGSLTDNILEYLQAPESCAALINHLKKQMPDEVPGTAGLIDDLYDVGKEALEPLYIPGKITPISVDLAEGKAAPSVLPPGRFPPWGGQKVNVPAVSKKKVVVNPMLAAATKAILKNPTFHLNTTYEGYKYLAGGVKNFFAGRTADTSPLNPFA